MQITIIPVTSFQQNCSLLWCEKSLQAAVIDPGGDVDKIIAEIDKQGVVLTQILLTHGHLDHVGATRALAEHYQVKVLGPQQQDAFLFQSLDYHAQAFGLPHCDPFLPDEWVNEGEVIRVGEEIELAVYHCPGHTPGHVVYVSQAFKIAFVGDVLFAGSIGRTDFPQGDYSALMAAICDKLLPLGEDIQFIPGHGGLSTFGEERNKNSFVLDYLRRRPER